MRRNFHWQIVVLIAAGMILLAVIGSLTAAFIINKRVSGLVHDHAAQITAQFAHQSILPLLSGVGENALADVNATLSHSNVKTLGIYKKSGELLIGSDSTVQTDLSNFFPIEAEPFEPTLVKESQTRWNFVAPVYDTDILAPGKKAELDALFTESPALLGYVCVTIDTSNLLKIQRELLSDNLSITVAIAAVLLFIAVLITRRLVGPLYKFISLMKQAEKGDDSVRAKLSGPVEIENMSRAFNTMMQALEQRRVYADQQHNSLLLEIDERTRIEQALRESETSLKSLLAHHQAVVATVPGIIFELDKEGKFKWWNKRVEQISGLGREQIEAMSAIDFVPADHVSYAMQALEEAFIDGKGELHTRLHTKDGLIPYQLIGVRIDALDGDSGLATLLVIGIDDSESVKAQQALKQARDIAIEAARLKSEFLANMSHEIRTPMNGMLGMIQLLANSALNSEQKGFADIALRSADHMMSIINDVLDFSKIEAGKLDIYKSSFVLRELVEDVIELFATKAYEKNLGIYADVLFDTPTTVYTDSNRLKQILSNLVSNAIKFTDQGYVLVKVSVDKDEHGSATFMIRVIDTGIGIDTNFKDAVFESFSQVDGSSTRRYSGTGLGLAIVKQLSRMLGGNVVLESELDKGSTFSIIFPLEDLRPGYDVEPLEYDFPEDLQLKYIDGDRVQSEIFEKYADFLGLDYQYISRDECAALGTKNQQLQLFVDAENFKALTASESWPTLSKFKTYVLVNHINSNKLDELVAAFDFADKQLIPLRFSSFIELLSRKSPKNVENMVAQTWNSVAPPVSGEKRVLVVEDNEVNQRVVVTMLKKLGYEALLAANGKQALDMLEQNSCIELILMDCQMPVMDGYATTKVIRENETGNRHISVIAMTGNALGTDKEKCLAAGMDDYVAKPIRLKALKEALEQWLPDE